MRLASLALVASLISIAGPVEAQMVVKPQTLDSSRQVTMDALVLLRDSLRTVEAQVAQLERGSAQASPQLLYSRGRSLAKACSRSSATLPLARAVVEGSSWEDSLATVRQGSLLRAIDRLETTLGGCEKTWADLTDPVKAEEIRTTGVSDAIALRNEIYAYASIVADYFKALNVRVKPIGTGPSPIP